MNSHAPDYWICDLNLAEKGRFAISDTVRDMPGLTQLEKRYRGKKPLAGVRITGCVIVTYETAAFALLLKKLGASLRWCSDNRFACLDDACAALVAENIPVFAKKGMTEKELERTFEEAVKFPEGLGPHIIIDDGCDITRYLHRKHPEIYKSVVGTVEQTTCGVSAHFGLASKGKLLTAVMNVNESVTKSKFDNIYGSRESLIEGLQKALNQQLGGKTAIVYGFGEVGKGCAKVLRGLGGEVRIVEIDPIMAMQAQMEGYRVANKTEANRDGDIHISATGCIKTISKNDIDQMKDGVVLANMGHGNMEIDTEYLYKNDKLTHERINPYNEAFIFPNGKRVNLLAGGYLLNLCCGQGHPPRVMGITFTNHVLAVLELLQHPKKYKKGQIYRMGRAADEEAARLNFPEIMDKLVKLTDQQAKYLGVAKNGPYKREDYRY